jgi:hypothetical protein
MNPQQPPAYTQAPQGAYPQQQYPPQGYPQQQFPQTYAQQPYPQQQQQPQIQYVTQMVQPVVAIVPSNNGSLIDGIFGPNEKMLVKQRIEPFEVVLGFETENKYDCHFSNGILACAFEESNFFGRWCLGTKRPFTLHVFFKDNKREFLRLERPYKFYFEEVNVIDSITNQKLGKVKRNFTCCERVMTVYDENNVVQFKIVSPFCEFWTFHIERNEQRVGSINKKFSGFLQEMMTDADNFGVHFPSDATPKQKALLFAATFLIDFLYFESDPSENRSNGY